MFSRERVKAPNALWVDMDWQWDATKVEGATVSVPVGRVRPQHGAALWKASVEHLRVRESIDDHKWSETRTKVHLRLEEGGTTPTASAPVG